MKNLYILIIACFVMIGCNQNKNANSESKNNVEDNIELNVSKPELSDTICQFGVDTSRKFEKVQIGNDFYELEIISYCKKSSSVKRISVVNQPTNIVDDYETDIILLFEKDTILKSRVNKKTFKDGLNEELYHYAVLKDVDFDFIRSNRLYFKAFFKILKAEKNIELDFAIFYRTNKKGQIDYLNSN